MAKLGGVNVLDMTDGIITKVEYDGEQYDLTEEDAHKGDLVLITDKSWEYATLGEFYLSVDVSCFGLPWIEVAEGHTIVNYKGTYRLFRKKRPAEVGEWVEIVEGCECHDLDGDRFVGFGKDGQGLVKVGTIGEVTETDDNGVYVRFDEGQSVDDSFTQYRHFFLQHDEYVIVDKPKPKFKVGDIVAVTCSKTPSVNKVRDVGRVAEHVRDFFRVEVPLKFSHYNWQEQNELCHATDEEIEQYKRALSFEEAGRELNEFKKGDLVRTKYSGILEVVGMSEGFSKTYVKVADGIKLTYMPPEACKLVATAECRVDLSE